MSNYPDNEKDRKKALEANDKFCKPEDVKVFIGGVECVPFVGDIESVLSEEQRVKNQSIEEWVDEYENGRKK